MKYLFELPYEKSEPNWTIKSYFDLIYNDGCFLDAVSNIVQKESFVLDGIYCFFPDMNSADVSDHFLGVKFGIGYPLTDKDIVIVSEDTCYQFIRLSCEKYLLMHPEDKIKIKMILSKNRLNHVSL
ncbi:TPA: ribonuclease toxin immunity protein CdiI [Proteus mirabilis]|nr:MULTISPECIES: ribonuclease toxin immunity protein CdiI [Proteus]AVA39470.1 hypothetical protein C3Z14_05420 [Proteus mirabilis]EHZ8014459.1 ribonuclease toxin immunity protein CdiI [Proteus mirabilis]EKU5733127.1 ribonuclease toxin immunity protein CdiI [Proteus mirabilis]EKV2709596.1 ribonuclease toxin immunity protein CdiI [Proteus mirabilis]EKW9420637.1 ribonuclease toxin immunity protein CdiI [Proteus mirabilis]